MYYQAVSILQTELWQSFTIEFDTMTSSQKHARKMQSSSFKNKQIFR